MPCVDPSGFPLCAIISNPAGYISWVRVTVCSFVCTVQKITFECFWKSAHQNTNSWALYSLCEDDDASNARPLLRNSENVKCKIIMKGCDDSHWTSSQIWNLNWFLLHFKSFGRGNSALECEPCVPIVVQLWCSRLLCPAGHLPLLHHDIGGALPPAPQRLHHHPGHRPLHPHAQPLVLLLHVQVWTHMWSDTAFCTGFPSTLSF